MKRFKVIVLTLLLTCFLSGCISTALKAPCNSTGSDCLPKIKINQWNNS